MYLSDDSVTCLRAVIWFILFITGLTFLNRRAVHLLKQWAAGTETKVDDGILEIVEKESRQTSVYFFIMVYLSTKIARIELPGWDAYLWPLFLMLFSWRVVVVLHGLTSTLMMECADFRENQTRTILKAVKIILLAVAGLFVSENSGLRVNTLMAGVSISGAVVALSSQALLQDLFAFFAILMDVPFVVGDKIRVGASELGTVESVGLRTTRVRDLNGELQIYANKDISNTRISSFAQMPWRRKIIVLEFAPHTTATEIESFIQHAKAVVEEHPRARFVAGRLSCTTHWGFEVKIIFKTDGTLDGGEALNVESELNIALVKVIERMNLELSSKVRLKIEQALVQAGLSLQDSKS